MASPFRTSGFRVPGGLAFGLYALHLFSIWGIAASNILLGLATLAGIRGRRWRSLTLPQLAPAMRLVGWFAFLLVLSVVFSYEPSTSVGALDDLFSLLPLVLTLAYVEHERQARVVWSGLIAVGAVLAAQGLLQVWLGSAALGLSQRMPGPFSHYQTFAGVLLLCDILALSSFLTARGRTKLLLAMAMFFITLALVANLTRGAWVALILSLLMLIGYRAPRALFAVVPALAVVVFLLPGPVRDRASTIFDLQNGSNYDRLCMVYAGAHMIAERPVLGIGPEVVEQRYPLYRHPSAPRDQRPHLHNSYLQIAAERGLTSLAVFLAILGSSLLLSLRNYHADGGLRGPRADLHLGSAAALVAYTLAALFEDNWADTEVQRIALFVIALPFCLHRIREDS